MMVSLVISRDDVSPRMVLLSSKDRCVVGVEPVDWRHRRLQANYQGRGDRAIGACFVKA
jgi:hypothetical protein